ncbi:MAG: type B 50S ribosomal protein L31 [Dermatophilaceae bacterium]
MRPNIHPRYEPVVFRDRSTGATFRTRSTRLPEQTVEWDGATYPVIDVEISADSHPFWTKRSRTIDTEGRVEAFHRRYGRRAAEDNGRRTGDAGRADAETAADGAGTTAPREGRR